MNFSPVLAVFVVCLALASSSGPSTETVNLNKQLRQTSHTFQSGYLCLTLAAASSGRNFVRLPEAVTVECARTAKAAMKLFVAPSTYQTTLALIYRGVNQTIATLKKNTVGNLAEALCGHLNREASKSPTLNFETTKRSVHAELPNAGHNYVTAIPPSQTVHQYMKGGEMIFVGDIEELVKFGTVREFHSYRDQKSDSTLRESMATATAVHQLSQHKNLQLREHVDKLFTLAFQNFYKQDVYNQTADYYSATISEHYAVYFARKLDTHFAQYPKFSSQTEYLRLKQEALKRVPNKTP